MSKNPFKTERFIVLRIEWEKKLEESGFKDIERNNSLKRFHSYDFQDIYTEDRFKEKSEYYYDAFQFLHIHEFKHEAHRQIWELHTHGIPYRDIAMFLKQKYPKEKFHFVKVGQIVREHQEEMRQWKKKTLETL